VKNDKALGYLPVSGARDFHRLLEKTRQRDFGQVFVL
jgi:hypothetical protein